MRNTANETKARGAMDATNTAGAKGAGAAAEPQGAKGAKGAMNAMDAMDAKKYTEIQGREGHGAAQNVKGVGGAASREGYGGSTGGRLDEPEVYAMRDFSGVPDYDPYEERVPAVA